MLFQTEISKRQSFSALLQTVKGCPCKNACKAQIYAQLSPNYHFHTSTTARAAAISPSFSDAVEPHTHIPHKSSIRGKKTFLSRTTRKRSCTISFIFANRLLSNAEPHMKEICIREEKFSFSYQTLWQICSGLWHVEWEEPVHIKVEYRQAGMQPEEQV